MNMKRRWSWPMLIIITFWRHSSPILESERGRGHTLTWTDVLCRCVIIWKTLSCQARYIKTLHLDNTLYRPYSGSLATLMSRLFQETILHHGISLITNQISVMTIYDESMLKEFLCKWQDSVFYKNIYC